MIPLKMGSPTLTFLLQPSQSSRAAEAPLHLGLLLWFHTQMPRVQDCISLCNWKEQCLIKSSLCECIFLNERHVVTFQQGRESTGSSCSANHTHMLLKAQRNCYADVSFGHDQAS